MKWQRQTGPVLLPLYWVRTGGEGPARTGASLHKQARQEDEESKRQDPEVPVVHAGQRYVRGPNHDGDQPVGEAG